MDSIRLRPFGIVKEIIEELGAEISYYYDDLIFVDNNTFLLCFDDAKQNNLKLYLNTDCEKGMAKKIRTAISGAAASREFKITDLGFFELIPKEGSEEIDIVFKDNV
ncbi:MAG: hypothetical protein JXA77_17840 [Bacteroidales bacterium]|nr:hypothetical protein [Bacteroidales bacterium]MBN2818008.1 hypothetical protein [Bacteroidales bacterium]